MRRFSSTIAARALSHCVASAQADSLTLSRSHSLPSAPLELVRLPPLMERTTGSPDVTIGLIDGPVVATHSDLPQERVRDIAREGGGVCTRPESAACLHGTFVAGILCARRGSSAPAICPDCTLLVRPIFREMTTARAAELPTATPGELARAILDCLEAGARVLNVSAAIVRPMGRTERDLQDALDQSARRGVIVIAAAGNQGIIGGTDITSHPWVIPVVAYDLQGRPMNYTNIGGSIGRRGLGAPGDRITSLGATGQPLTLDGTSAAAPFVTGTVALLWSEFRDATAAAVKFAVTRAAIPRRQSVVPPLLDAGVACQMMHSMARS
jgi:subtilisin family serine protease